LGQDEDMQANEENEEPRINPNEQWGLLVAAQNAQNVAWDLWPDQQAQNQAQNQQAQI
jgi:hypothetical protein